MADLILSFFGIPSSNNQNQPTIRALENAMSSHSKVPCWIDEFVPESPNNKAKISDQLFNVWYELRTRPTSSGANRKRNEEKIVRCMLMFCSNFVPVADHLNSRALKFEYNFHKRGDESHYYWLAERKAELQRLYIGYMSMYSNIDRKNLRHELIAMKGIVRSEANKLIEIKKKRMGGEYNLEDRQVESIAALVVSYNEFNGYNNVIKMYLDKLDETNDQAMADVLIESIAVHRKSSIVFTHGIKFLAENAMKVGERDALTEFLSTIEYMVTEGNINEKYYGWMGDDLKIWFEGLWIAYVDRVRDRAVTKDTVRGKIAALASRPEPTTMNWTDNFGNIHRKHGFRITNASKDHRFQYCFKHTSIMDNKEDIPIYDTTKDKPSQGNLGLIQNSPFDL